MTVAALIAAGWLALNVLLCCTITIAAARRPRHPEPFRPLPFDQLHRLAEVA